jgi:hypothetical protein
MSEVRRSRVLLVDVDAEFVRAFHDAYAEVARMSRCNGFPAARKALLTDRPDFLVTRLRLGAYNGLHLAYLVAANGLRTTTIAYDDPIDLALAREGQRIGAFVEHGARVVNALGGYLSSSLPPFDRRSPAVFERRRRERGGRRGGDLPRRRRIAD